MYTYMHIDTCVYMFVHMCVYIYSVRDDILHVFKGVYDFRYVWLVLVIDSLPLGPEAPWSAAEVVLFKVHKELPKA